MRLHRFYINQKIGNDKETTLSDPGLSHQLSHVFRLKSGNEIIIFDGSGFEYVSQIQSVSPKEIVLSILEKVDKSPEVSPEVSLYLSLIKKGNFELAVEKCTEVGVTEIHPIMSERSEKKDINLERLGKIAKEASEQSGRVILPEIFDVTDLETAVSQAVSDNKVCVAFHTVSDSSTAPSPSLSKEGKGKEMAIFVGPEGGWTDKEVELFKKNNFQICSLGQNILRAETAAIVAVWNVKNN